MGVHLKEEGRKEVGESVKQGFTEVKYLAWTGREKLLFA